jgi:hypothetical protein
MEHEDQSLFLHCPDSIGPGSEVMLFREKINMGAVPSFHRREEVKALVHWTVTPITVTTDGKIKYNAGGSRLQKHLYEVEWIGQFQKGSNIKVEYVESVTLQCTGEEEMRIGGEVRLANGSRFKNPASIIETRDQHPWIFDKDSVVGCCCCFERNIENIEKKVSPKVVQRRLMLRDPRAGFEDQCVGWVAPRADIERTEDALKSAESRNCRQAGACCCLCPCYICGANVLAMIC